MCSQMNENHMCTHVQMNYTEHCSVGPTKLIETTIGTARLKIYGAVEDF